MAVIAQAESGAGRGADAGRRDRATEKHPEIKRLGCPTGAAPMPKQTHGWRAGVDDRLLDGRGDEVRQGYRRRAQRSRLCDAARGPMDGPERSQRHGSAVFQITLKTPIPITMKPRVGPAFSRYFIARRPQAWAPPPWFWSPPPTQRFGARSAKAAPCGSRAWTIQRSPGT